MTVSLNPPEFFDTPRLLLRAPRLDDAPTLFESYTSDLQIPKFMSWKPHTDIEQTRQFLSNCLSDREKRQNFDYIIELKEQAGHPIGMISLHPLDQAVGFGYVIAKVHWNKGITSEALTTLVNWSLQQGTVFRAQAFCDVENLASAKVMEKAGMKFEGTLRRYFVHPNISPEPRNVLMYAKIK